MRSVVVVTLVLLVASGSTRAHAEPEDDDAESTWIVARKDFPGRTNMIVGSLIFAAGFGVQVVLTAVADSLVARYIGFSAAVRAERYIPLIGPFHSMENSASNRVFWANIAAAQLLGLAVHVAGVGQRIRRAPFVVPVITRDAVGLSLRLTR